MTNVNEALHGEYPRSEDKFRGVNQMDVISKAVRDKMAAS